MKSLLSPAVREHKGQARWPYDTQSKTYKRPATTTLKIVHFIEVIGVHVRYARKQYRYHTKTLIYLDTTAVTKSNWNWTCN